MLNKKVVEGRKTLAVFMGFPLPPPLGSLWDYNRSLDQSYHTKYLRVMKVIDDTVIFEKEMPYKGYGIEYFDGKVFKPAYLTKEDHAPCRPYERDWNWLMPIVFKCESKGLHINITHHGIRANFAAIKRGAKFYNEKCSDSEDAITHVFKVLVKFINELSNHSKSGTTYRLS